MADINKIKLGDTQYELGATKVKPESNGSSNSTYELLSTPSYSNGTYQKVSANHNLMLYPLADSWNATSDKYFEGGPTVVIGNSRAADCIYEYDNGWEDENGNWVDDWVKEFDTSISGTGHLEVAGNLIVGGGSDEYGIFPYQHNYSLIGDDNHRWYQIHGTQIYEGGKSLTSKYQAIGTVHSTNTSSKIYLVGTTSQGSSKTAYSHDTAYVGTDGCLYSGGAKVLTSQTTAYNYIGAADAASNAATTNGSTYLKLYEGGTKRSQFKISGSGAASVASDTSGNLTISSTDTKNTTGSTNSTSKLYLVGATTQAANPQTYSNSAVYATNGTLSATAFSGSGASLTALNADNISSGTLPITRGGTGATAYNNVKLNLGIPLVLRPGNSGSTDVTNGWYKVCTWKNSTWLSYNIHMTLGTSNYCNYVERPSNISVRLSSSDTATAAPIVYLNGGSASILKNFYIVLNPANTTDTIELWYKNTGKYSIASVVLHADNHRSSAESFKQLTICDVNTENTTYTSGKTAYCLSDHVVVNSECLPLAGGTVTGAVTMPTLKLSEGITFLNESYTDAPMIKFKTGDNNGAGILIGGGGYVGIGSGESAGAVFDAISATGGNESVHISSDNAITFYTNCQTIANRITTTIDTSGNVSAISFTARSDRRLKENIESYTCPNSILDLDVKKFDFINGAKNQIGCIAQELQEICPELIKEDENGYLSIYESKLVYPLLLKVKEQEKRLKALELMLKYRDGED